MPTYQYRCTDCGHEFEEFQSFTDDALAVCPACGGTLRKVFNAVGVVFKGSGFYRNDSRSPAASESAASESAAPSSGTSGSSSKSSSTDPSKAPSTSSTAPSSTSSPTSPAGSGSSSSAGSGSATAS